MSSGHFTKLHACGQRMEWHSLLPTYRILVAPRMRSTHVMAHTAHVSLSHVSECVSMARCCRSDGGLGRVIAGEQHRAGGSAAPLAQAGGDVHEDTGPPQVRIPYYVFTHP